MINLNDLLYEDVNINNKMWGMKVVIMVEIKLYNCNFVIQFVRIIKESIIFFKYNIFRIKIMNIC